MSRVDMCACVLCGVQVMFFMKVVRWLGLHATYIFFGIGNLTVGTHGLTRGAGAAAVRRR